MVLLTVILLLGVGGKYGHMLDIHGKSNQDNFFFFSNSGICQVKLGPSQTGVLTQFLVKFS